MTKRLVGGVALLAALHFLVSAARGCGDEPAPAETATLMPAAGGPIEELGVQFHRPGAERFLPVYRELFAALRPETHVRVAVADAEDERIFEAARRGWGPGPRVSYVRVGRAITSWARDRLAVLETGRGSVLLAPPRPMDGPEARVHDHLVPWALRRELAGRARIRTAPFRFDGGDLIADEARAYVATPLFARNPDRDPDDVARELEETLGLELVRIEGEVPDHHIGMFVTPLGGGRVAYGDPDVALAALGLREGEAATVEVGGEPLALDLSPARLARFRNVRAALEAHGLEAVPVPILPAAGNYVFLSYDNVLLERRADGLHVVLPTYGVDALDRAAVEAWEALGATVHPVRVDGVFRLGGSVRCLVAPLVRG